MLEQGGELITGSELAVVAHRRLTDGEEIEACSLYADQRRTLREIAQLYGLTPSGVLKILIRNNIARWSKGGREIANDHGRGRARELLGWPPTRLAQRS